MQFGYHDIPMRWIAIGMMLALCSCSEPVLEFAPPEQRPPIGEYRSAAARVISMDEPDAPRRFVRDISEAAAANWRWTGQSPAVRIRVRSTENLKYVIDFTIADATYKETGPVTVTFTVNDHVLDRVRYASPGAKHFEKAVPAGWLEAGKDAIAGAQVDKVWVSKEDGARLGLILSRIGFTQ